MMMSAPSPNPVPRRGSLQPSATGSLLVSSEVWPRRFPFQHGDLLLEGEDFEGGIASTTEEDSDGSKEEEEDFGHEHTF